MHAWYAMMAAMAYWLDHKDCIAGVTRRLILDAKWHMKLRAVEFSIRSPPGCSWCISILVPVCWQLPPSTFGQGIKNGDSSLELSYSFYAAHHGP